MQSYNILLDESPEVQRKIAKAVVEERQQVILEIIRMRFPALLDIAKQQVMRLDSKSALKYLTKGIVLAPNEKIAEWVLDTVYAVTSDTIS